MKRTFLTLFSMFSCLLLFAQTRECDNRLDSSGVIRIAKRHHAWWTKDWGSPPQLSFNATSCEWTVFSTKSKHTNRGDCKHTNGCTLVRSVTLVIDARTKKVKSKKKEKELFPNYE